MNDLLTPENKQEIEHWLKKFPEDQRQSAIIPALMSVQKSNGNSLTNELMDAVAEYLGVPNIAVYEVATFYTMFKLKPVGKHLISVCDNVSCMLRGCSKLVDHLKQKFDVNLNEVSKDGNFTVETVECLGACIGAPVIQVGDEYHENMTVEKLDKLVEELSN